MAIKIRSREQTNKCDNGADLGLDRYLELALACQATYFAS